jgi:hypothetical protein
MYYVWRKSDGAPGRIELHSLGETDFEAENNSRQSIDYLALTVEYSNLLG